MPGEHAYKKNCFKMNGTGLYKIEKKKNGNKSYPFERHCFKKATEVGPKFGGPKGGFMKKEEGGAYKMEGPGLGMAGPVNPYSGKRNK